MYLGNRRIRSAGRSSGSIEITLPTELQLLEGAECRLLVRDGYRPEIVLLPDLSAAQTLFREIWQKLRLGLREVDDIGDFALSDFTLCLFPPHQWQERPPLAYADALALLRQQPARQEQEPEALTRLLAFLSVVAGYRLGLKGSLALAFGDAIAYLVTGAPTGLDTDFERGMAHRLLWGNGHVQPLASPLKEPGWRQVQPGLRRVYEQFRAWQEDIETYTAARVRWYRVLPIEIGMSVAVAAES